MSYPCLAAQLITSQCAPETQLGSASHPASTRESQVERHSIHARHYRKWSTVSDVHTLYRSEQILTLLSTSLNIYYFSLLVPCAPQNVKYTSDGESGVLSWNASVFANKYTVYNVSGTGRTSLCSTAGLSCQLSNFDPATTELTASNEEGESIPTQDITGRIKDVNISTTLLDSHLSETIG